MSSIENSALKAIMDDTLKLEIINSAARKLQERGSDYARDFKKIVSEQIGMPADSMEHTLENLANFITRLGENQLNKSIGTEYLQELLGDLREHIVHFNKNPSKLDDRYLK